MAFHGTPILTAYTPKANSTLIRLHKKKHLDQNCQSPRDCLQHTYVSTHCAGICCPIWDSHLKQNISQKKVRCRAVRWAHSSVTAMLHNLGWRTLEQRREDARQYLFYKIAFGCVAMPLPVYIQMPNSLSHLMTYTQMFIC